ncbi:MAG: glycosyltransferase family 39 protein [Acidobacteriota bacterium]|nr:glycosyltransferase family 39 protein [Acidobacteriota bacterium]
MLHLAAVLAVAYVCFWHGATRFGLVGPDEPRYAAIARDMSASNDWVTPRLHGEPWLEKPILYYWVAAGGYLIFGDTERAARLPSFLGAVGSLLGLLWLTTRFYDTNTTKLFALIFPSSLAGLVFARAATPDMLFSAALALALVAAAPLALEPGLRRVRMYQVCFGAALGFAVLAKGPAGIVLAGGGSALGALLTRRIRSVWRLAGPWAVGSFAVVALPWYVLCSIQNPEFVQIFLLSHNVDRFLTPVFQHAQPFWFFVPVMMLGLAPWTGIVVSALATVGQTGGRLSERWAGSPSVFLAGWALFPILFFSLSQSKLPGYVLPAIPAATLLLSVAAAHVTRAKRERWVGVGTTTVLAAMTLTFLVAPGVESSGVAPGAVRPLAFVLTAATILTGYQTWRRRVHSVIAVSALSVAATLLQLNTQVLPQIDPAISTRTVANAVRRHTAGDPIRVFQLHRAWQYGLEYYLHKPLHAWSSTDPPGTVVVTTTRGMRQMQLDGAGIVVLGEISPQALLVRTDPGGEKIVGY